MSTKKNLPKIDRSVHQNEKNRDSCKYPFVFDKGDFRGLVIKEKNGRD